jgi:hypothetical protein
MCSFSFEDSGCRFSSTLQHVAKATLRSMENSPAFNVLNLLYRAMVVRIPCDRADYAPMSTQKM